MPVPTSISDLSSTASSNYPSGSESIGTSLDDYLRAHASIIKQVSDAKADASTAVTLTGTQTVQNKTLDTTNKFIRSAQIGNSGTATQNFSLEVPASPDGTLKLARGNAGATTQDVMTVDASGKVAFPQGLTAVAGEVIQEVMLTGTASNVGSTSYVLITGTVTITPKSTNSTLVVTATFPSATIAAAGAGTNNQGTIDLYENTTTSRSASIFGVVSGSGTNVQTNASVTVVAALSNAALTSRNFQCYGKCAVAAGQLTPGTYVLSVREVQN